MKKHFATSAFVYVALALACGVFYREFTKLSGFAGQTVLSGVHTHYMTLGMFFFLLLLALDREVDFSAIKRVRGLLAAYHVGLNIAAGMMVVRGVLEVQGTAMSAGLDASISGVAGIGHMTLGVSLLLLLWQLRKRIVKS